MNIEQMMKFVEIVVLAEYAEDRAFMEAVVEKLNPITEEVKNFNEPEGFDDKFKAMVMEKVEDLVNELLKEKKFKSDLEEGGWIENTGELPVPVGTPVDAIFRNGERVYRSPAGTADPDDKGTSLDGGYSSRCTKDWSITGDRYDITYYRVSEGQGEQP